MEHDTAVSDWLYSELTKRGIDGRLIAAAPDLLRLLQEAVRLYAQYGLADSGQWVTEARSTIAKATE